MESQSFFVRSLVLASFAALVVWSLLVSSPVFAGGADNGRLDITFISQGYSDFNAFHADAQRFADYLLTIEPFKSRASQIDFRNVDNPIDLVCASAGGVLECNSQNAINAVEASGTPYDKIVVIANNPALSGRSKTTVATITNPAGAEKIFVHEFGHLLGGLKDEYTSVSGSGGMTGAIDANCYAGTPPASAWTSVAPRDYGIGCVFANWSRPSKASIMYTSESKYFDVVAQAILNQKFDQYAGAFVDTSAPAAQITSPLDGDTVSGRVTIAPSLSDDHGIARAELWKDGALYTTSYVSPFTFTWDPPLNESAAHTFEVRAYDAAGNMGSSGVVQVAINGGIADTERPAAYMISPTQNSPLIGTQQILLYATDNSDALGQAYFYLDSSLLATDSTAPYAYDWNTTQATQGSHMLYAYVYDLSNNWTATTPITVMVDNVPPQASITAPANNATVSGSVMYQVGATDDLGVISRVEFLLDGNPISVDSQAPYEYSWDTTTVTNGTHVLKAAAYDARTYAFSTPVTVTVNNVSPDTVVPVLSITSPAQGATVQGTSTVSVAATDNVGVTKVELYRDGALVATDSSSPYSLDWDTKAVSNGSHALIAKAYDAANNSASSAARTVTVNNPDVTLPSVSIASPINGATVPKNTNVTIQASASDNIAVQKVEFFVGTTLKCTDTSAPYSCVWKTPASKGAQILKATATDTSNNKQSSQITVNVN